jgi:hypothetical protein
MDVTIQAVLGIAVSCSILAGAVCGGLLYVVRAEQAGKLADSNKAIALVDSRIARHEAECAQRNKNADERHDRVTAHLESMDDKLDRLIERLL